MTAATSRSWNPQLEFMHLDALTDVTAGRADVVIGLIDGPVDITHPDLDAGRVNAASGIDASCALGGDACLHGTFVAGILSARRGTAAPAVCPGCTLLVRPIFTGTDVAIGELRAPSEDLAAAIVDCIDGGAHLINISAALVGSSVSGQRALVNALDLAARRDVPVFAAAGNNGLVGGTAITRHGWVCPVVAYSDTGIPLARSDAGRSIGRHGLGALGHDVTSLRSGGGYLTASGTSVATAFVTGAAALIWSAVPDATGMAVRSALAGGVNSPRRGIVPPLVDAWSSYRQLAAHEGR
jgi:subtilisin family serine protease